MWGWIILGLLVMVIAFLAVFRFLLDHREVFDVYSDDKILNDNYFYCELSIHGGMSNQDTGFRLSFTDNDYAELEYHDVPMNGEKEKKRKIRVDRNVVESCKEIYKKYGVLFWTDLKKSEIEALDAPTTTLKFSSSKASVSFTDDLEFPDNGHGIFADIEKLFEEALNKNNF